MSYWLVERYIGNQLHFWCAGARGRGSRDDWSLDPDWTTKLHDEESAHMVLFKLCDGEGRTVEHMAVKP